ncbi:MAG: putative RNA uridine N3 methyltransferase [Nitrososphaerales archaeon]|jgi:predicted SPOUT superfamily RNA methylase MTH1
MTLRGKRITVAFPDTVLEEHDSLREKTVKLGQLARACSIFGVDSVQVFHDPRGGGEAPLIRRVLEYLETPQYLRKRLFPLDESLKYAGLLPPLRIPSHKPKVAVTSLRTGEFREGAVLDDGVTVDVGLEMPLALSQRVTARKRLTVKITSTTPLQGVPANRSHTGEYWGYYVEERGLEELLTDPRFGLKIATSRLGDPLETCLAELGGRVRASASTMLLFGSPSRGLFDMSRDLRKRVGFVVNLYPEQHVVTVRTEEAIASALYLLEVLNASQNTKV